MEIKVLKYVFGAQLVFEVVSLLSVEITYCSSFLWNNVFGCQAVNSLISRVKQSAFLSK